MGNLPAKIANNNLKGTAKEAEQICEKRRRDSLLFGEHTLTTSIRSLALSMLSDDVMIWMHMCLRQLQLRAFAIGTTLIQMQ
jgi:hypothetical protein